MSGSGEQSGNQSGEQSKPGDDIGSLITKFGLFTTEAEFARDKNGVEQCTDPRLKEKARQLFKALGYEKEATLPLQRCTLKLTSRPDRLGENEMFRT
jgi:hypothetical protein